MILSVATADASHLPSVLRSDKVGNVEVWSYLTHARGDLASARTILDEAERDRATRFRFEPDHRRFVQRHAFARVVLAGYLGCDPARIAFRIAPGGKPRIDGCDDLSFNLSHDDDLTVLVVGDGRPVGVDVERVRPVDAVDQLVVGLFTPNEVGTVCAAPLAARSLTFLDLWTRKEAVVKAMGVGLSLPLDEFTVLAGTGTGSVVGRPHHAGHDLPYAFASLNRLPGYVGTVACAGEGIAVRVMGDGGPA